MDSDSSTGYLRMMKAIKLNTNEKRIPFLPLMRVMRIPTEKDQRLVQQASRCS